jgi:hypothetical protein
MPKHRAFYSFHYVPDNWRASGDPYRKPGSAIAGGAHRNLADARV